MLKLRTDGIYVQFGYRKWDSWLGETDDCWYNMFKVVDDKNMVLLGQFNMNPFYEIDAETHKPIERTYKFATKSCSSYSYEDEAYSNEVKYVNIDNQKYIRNVARYSKETNHEIDNNDIEPSIDMYSYLNLDLNTDNFNVINIVKKLENFDWNSLNNKITITGIEKINYRYPKNNNDDDDDEDEEKDDIIVKKHVCGCDSNEVNDPFSLVTYTDDTNSLYINYSHCWVEGGNCGERHFDYGTEEDNGKQIPFKYLTSSFKFTFVPFDLSEKSIWMDEYIKWRERFEYHKYYLNKN